MKFVPWTMCSLKKSCHRAARNSGNPETMPECDWRRSVISSKSFGAIGGFQDTYVVMSTHYSLRPELTVIAMTRDLTNWFRLPADVRDEEGRDSLPAHKK